MSGERPIDLPGDGPAEPGLPPACAAVDEDLSELALGALSGKRRVRALAHLESCARCSAIVDELSSAADQLLHLAPEAEPPMGFEANVFQRLRQLNQPPVVAPARRRWVRSSSRLLAAAAAVVLLLGLGVGVLVARGNGNGRAGEEPIQLASLVSHGHDMGQVYVYDGNPTWLFMVIYRSDWQGTLRCEVTMDDGPPIMLGKFWLSGGKGAWADTVDQPAGRLREARVVSATGQVLASADLAAA